MAVPTLPVPAGYDREVDSFSYTFPRVASLASNATTTLQIQLQQDTEFVHVKTALYARLNGATFTDSSRPILDIDLKFEDTGSGANLQNDFVPAANITGSGNLPFVQSIPRLYKPSSTIIVTIRNNEAVSVTNIGLTLLGYKRRIGAGQ